MYLSLHCHHQNDSCIKMGSDESDFINCDGQSRTAMSTDCNFWKERRAEADSNRSPSAYQPNALPLGQTSSQPVVGGWERSHCMPLQYACGERIVCFVVMRAPLINLWRTKPLHVPVIILWRTKPLRVPLILMRKTNLMFCRHACPFNTLVENEAIASPFNTWRTKPLRGR